MTNYYPEPLQHTINTLNNRIYDTINNGVYRAGFATTLTAYEEEFHSLSGLLDKVVRLLPRQHSLAGDTLLQVGSPAFEKKPLLIRTSINL